MIRRQLVGLLVLMALSASAFAHHGWRWTSGTNIELTGDIIEANLGNPHGVLKVQVNDEVWTVEVGQPWRNERAGIKPGDLAAGVELKVSGEPSADDRRLLKAERMWIGTQRYELYPDRE